MYLANRDHEFLTSAAVDVLRESFIFFLNLFKPREFGLLVRKQKTVNNYAVDSSMLYNLEVLLPTQEHVHEMVAVELGVVTTPNKRVRIYSYLY